MEKKSLKIYGINKNLYADMARDLAQAEESIYLETFIFREDRLGKKFKEILSQKSKEKLDVRLLMDGIGSAVSSEIMFGEFLASGGQLKFFKRPFFTFFLLEQLNFRDHRKLLIIDQKIVYLGSSNVDANTSHWWELNIRVENPALARLLKKVFFEIYAIANDRRLSKNTVRRIEAVDNTEILCGSPSFRVSLHRSKLVELIGRANRSILIQMPYAIVDAQILRAMQDALERKVEIILVAPQKSDSLISNIINHEYFAKLHLLGVDVRLYYKNMLHAKGVVIDEKIYLFGSSNLDYRSYFWHFELDLAGDDSDLAALLTRHFKAALRHTLPFSYLNWRKRSLKRKAAGKLLWLFKFVL